mgnify:CR=1 FL=1
MAAPRRRTKPRRQARTRSTALAAAPGPALRRDLTPAAVGADLFELMGNMAARCAELPLRLLRARSPSRSGRSRCCSFKASPTPIAWPRA